MTQTRITPFCPLGYPDFGAFHEMDFIGILFILFSARTSLSWNPDAGIVTSFTKLPDVTVQTNSGSDGHLVIDDDDGSHWTSANCLPSGFFARPDVNVLLHACADGKCALSNSPGSLTPATDGNVYTVARVKAVANSSSGTSHASLLIQIRPNDVLQILSVNGIYKSQTSLVTIDDSGVRHAVAVLTSSDNYRDVQFSNITGKVAQIELLSVDGFSVKEIAAIGSNGCIETVTVNLTKPQSIGTLRTRHWAGSGSSFAVSLKLANDTANWHTVASLDPNALRPVLTQVEPPQTASYIRLEYHINLKKYAHVYCWEVDAWDEYGKWGVPIEAKPQNNSIRDILGVNGIWGWGHNKYSDLLQAGQGPALYAPLASHARNYHNLNWDVTDPDERPDFVNMAAGHGTQAKSWLNWDREYSVWRKAGLLIDTSIQFTNKTFPEISWNEPEKAAFNYGFEFASHFGPEVGNGLVYAMEVGNEPWDYDSHFYASVLKHMSAGVRSVDDKIFVLPGAFQASDKHELGTYIGTRVLENIASNISAINSHHYSFVTLDSGVRTATYPEHRDSTFNELRNIIRWRNTNTPNKPLWVTEWGWDAPHGAETCAFPECVTEEAAALYAVRGLMILTRHGIVKATWYFYANSDYCATLFCRSGLTGSKNINFAKTFVYHAFEKLLDLLGSRYFLASLQETAGGYVYVFTDYPLSPTARLGPQCCLELATHIVAWRPTDVSDAGTSSINIELPAGRRTGKVTQFTGDERGTREVPGSVSQVGTTVTLTMSTHPIVVEITTEPGQIVG